MEKPIYRIKVEVIGGEVPEEEIDKKMMQGFKCNGFALLLDSEDSSCIAMHRLSIMDLAEAIEKNDQLFAASMIARGKKEAIKYLRERKASDFLDALKNGMK